MSTFLPQGKIRLYIGVTSDIGRRIWEHKNGLASKHTKKYSIHKLVYVEEFDDIESAIRREKAMKEWNRDWKLAAINKLYPDWADLYGA